MRLGDAEPDAALAGGRHRPLEGGLAVADELAVLECDPVAPPLAQRRLLELVHDAALGQHLMRVQVELEPDDRRHVVAPELADHSTQIPWS